MPIPTWSVGQVLTASDVNTWFVPLNVVKPSTQSITSNATPANDSALVVAVGANRTYNFECFIIYDGGTQGAADIKFQMAGPASFTYQAISQYVNTSGNQIGANYIDDTTSPATQAGSNGAGNKRPILIKGSVETAGTAGNFALQWSQGTSNGTATRVWVNSYLNVWRVA